MKKLMFGLAIAAVGSAFAVESSNVVGYQQIGTAASGNVLVSPTFLNVGESNKVTLADVKVTGYDAPYWDTSGKKGKNVGGCQGAFVIQTLTTSGTMDQRYVWLDYTTSATTKVGPGWFADDAATPISGGEASVELDAGKALWIQGSGYSLQPTGAVNPFDVVFKTVASGNVAIGNCMPVGTRLSDLTVTGYDAPYWDTSGKKGKNVGGCQGAFVIQTLTTNGTMDQRYVWLDYTTSATTKVGPGWFADDAATPISGGASNVILDPGKGLWVQGSGYNLVVPAPEL